jgi:hypothetical protein
MEQFDKDELPRSKFSFSKSFSTSFSLNQTEVDAVGTGKHSPTLLKMLLFWFFRFLLDGNFAFIKNLIRYFQFIIIK